MVFDNFLHMKIYLLFLIIFQSLVAKAQSLDVLEKDLMFHADVMANAQNAVHRKRAAESFYTGFYVALKGQGSFLYPFDSLIWVSKKQPADNSFRLFTWIVDEGNGTYKHYGILQVSSGAVYELQDKLAELDDWEYLQNGPDEWLGAMYYHIMEDESDGRPYYLLFGLHRFDAYENVKLVDILQFEKDGKPSFGSEVFLKKEAGERDLKKTRIVLKYNRDSYVGLHYNPGMNMIVHDHLIPEMGIGGMNRLSLVSDGSLVGYEKKKGVWVYIDKIFTQVLDEAPRPKPVLDKRGKDLFGRDTAPGDKK